MKEHNSASVSRICWRVAQSKHDGVKEAPAYAGPSTPTAAHLVFFFLVLLVGTLVSTLWINTSMIGGGGSRPAASHDQTRYPQLTCPTVNRPTALSCPAMPPPQYPHTIIPPSTAAACGDAPSPAGLCPAYFRWIHEDLQPWARTGITREMVERAKENASFRLVVLGGRAYVERYGRRTFQTRELFTQWGILQLLRRHPGRVPDLELMFDCVDHPAVMKSAYPGDWEDTPVPPLFRYSGSDSTLDIVFPDWSFWGWSEINIKPWEPLLEDLREGNRRVKWVERDPYAYWKGNPLVAAGRQDLLRCNVSGTQDWNARLYAQDWGTETKQGFKNSDLASQCKHRYKIYIEGSTWSVSEKYILACDSPTLLVRPRYYDFYSRGLEPLRHYWPLRSQGKCPSIKFAVDWGNNHQDKAQELGKGGSGFIQEEVKMDYVYDYMLHLLNEYAKLLRFKPTKPPGGAVELCPELLDCSATGLAKEFMVASTVEAPRDAGPCVLPPPFSPAEMRLLMAERANSTQLVELWEKNLGGWDLGQKQTKNIRM